MRQYTLSLLRLFMHRIPSLKRLHASDCRALTVIAAAAALVLAPAQTAVAQSADSPDASGETRRMVTLMPLGDSITAMRNSYRYALLQRLRDAGYMVRYVGSRVGPASPDYPKLGRLRHDGYGGKNIQFIAERLRLVYPEHPADIVLLHAGHNQFADQKPVPGVVAATRDIIEYVRSVNPQVTVLLAQVITSGKLPKYSYIPELNSELAKLAAELDTPEQRVILVDMADGWDWQTDTTEDKVHPTPAGGEKMAGKWYEALVQILPSLQASAVPATPATPASPAVSTAPAVAPKP